MGATVAYEVALRLAGRGTPGPVRLIVSGRQAPQYSHSDPDDRGEDALLRDLAQYGGTPAELLGNPQMRALLLARMAADYELIDTYRPAPVTGQLSCPVTAMTGDQDPDLAIEEIAGWAAVTSGPFDIEVFPGGHFYLIPQKKALYEALAQRLLA
jgi:pyochelin biosynthesis protein PchC